MTSDYQRVSAAHFTWNAAGTGCFPLLTHLGRTFPLYFNSHPRCHARTYHQLPSKPHTQFSLRHPTPQLCPKSDTEGHHDGYYNVANYRSALTIPNFNTNLRQYLECRHYTPRRHFERTLAMRCFQSCHSQWTHHTIHV
jgi:hypothetical protein